MNPISILLILMILVSQSALGSDFENVIAEGEKGGNGSDNVEPLFIQAQQDAVGILEAIQPDLIDSMPLEIAYKNWLKEPGRLGKLLFYAKTVSLEFIESPCFEDGNLNQPRGACYDPSDPMNPKMIVSRSYNKATTPDQATAMVIHEAGHFTGEKDHIFLTRLGVALVHPASAPLILFSGIGTYLDADNLVDMENIALARAEEKCHETKFAYCPFVSVERSFGRRIITVRGSHSPKDAPPKAFCRIMGITPSSYQLFVEANDGIARPPEGQDHERVGTYPTFARAQAAAKDLQTQNLCQRTIFGAINNGHGF